jgi:predicted ABC-type ATPase
VLAGPNGAGKTTFAREFLPAEAQCPIFINADLIAAGLAPFNPEAASMRAGRLMLEEINRHLASAQSFALETTLSGLGYARQIAAWQRLGYRVELIYLALRNPEMAVKRVALRVTQGGHDIKEAVIRRRFEAGLRNFEQVYKPLVDSWLHYDNSGLLPLLIDGKNL